MESVTITPVILERPKRQHRKGSYFLTDVECANAKPRSDGGVRRLRDGNNLYLEVSPAGGKAWYVDFYDGRRNAAGKPKKSRVQVGEYPATGVALARDKRDDVQRQLAAGISPLVQKKIDKAAIVATWDASAPFRVVGAAWYAIAYPEATTAATTARNNTRYLACVMDGYGGPKGLGDLPIEAITYAHVINLLDAANAVSPQTRDRMQVTIRRIFAYACGRNRTLPNPVAGAKWSDVYGKLPVTEHHAAATDADSFAGVLRKIDALATQVQAKFSATCNVIDDRLIRAYLKLLALTFVRPVELRIAEWTEFKLDADVPVWMVPVDRLKQRTERKRRGKPNKPHRVPLAPQAVAILRELHALTGNGKYLFPGAYGAGAPVCDSTLRNKLRLAGIDTQAEHTLHGFRAVAETMLTEAVDANEDRLFTDKAIDYALNHIKGTYNDGDYFRERIRIHSWWADHIDMMRDGAKVIRLAA